jgi:hypothetical protein
LFKRSVKSGPAAPRAKREKSTSTKGYYVNNAVLLPAVIHAKSLNVVTSELIGMIKLIAERYSRKANFIGYSFRDDMVSAAVANLCNTALKFDPERYSNPFAYYTSAIHNSFLQFMADEKKHRNIRDALIIDAGSNPSFNFMQAEKDESHFEIKESDEAGTFEKATNADYEAALGSIVTPGTMVDGVLVPAPEPVENFVRHPGRQHGPVTIYSPEDYSVDEKGNITILAPAEPEPVIVKPKYKLTADHVIGGGSYSSTKR